MAETLWVTAMMLLIGAFGAAKFVPWDEMLFFGKALMLNSAAIGVPLEIIYFTLLGLALTWTRQRPPGWYWRSFKHHHLLTRSQRLWVLPWFVSGAIAFVGIVLGIAITVLGMVAAAMQNG